MKRRIKKKPIIILILCIILVIFGIKSLIETINYHKTYEYKFQKLGYTYAEYVDLIKLDDTTLNYLLTIDYNKKIPKLIKEKYFMEKNIKKYISYLDKNDNIKDIIAIINVGADNKWYENTKKTDLTKDHLILTNKFNYLDNTYNSDNMSKVSKQYSYGDNQWLTNKTYEAFLQMFNAASKEGLTLIINSSYRSYEEQDEIYSELNSSKGEEYADKIAARPGYSEHQTGMAIDIQTYGSTSTTFDQFDEFKWLEENAHKYGFILRYPKGKEYLTGYEYESWHYRYVGTDVAKYIFENNITFDEYYAYYLN